MMVQMRIETDPADRTQLRMTVSSGDPTLTFEYVLSSLKLLLLCTLETCSLAECSEILINRLKEFIKEQLVSIPTATRPPAPEVAQPTSAATSLTDPGAMLAGLL